MLSINNPGNIRKDGQHWLGETEPSSNASFKEFDTIAYGYRAMFIDLRSKINAGTNTLRKIIYKYAPPSENNTTAYVTNVSNWANVNPDKVLTLNDGNDIFNIVCAMSRMENGVQANIADVQAGFDLQESIKKKL